MNTVYSISKGALTLDDGSVILTYGIEATDKESGETISSFDDVSVNKSVTERIISILNSCEVEICHFKEVITDELNR